MQVRRVVTARAAVLWKNYLLPDADVIDPNDQVVVALATICLKPAGLPDCGDDVPAAVPGAVTLAIPLAKQRIARNGLPRRHGLNSPTAPCLPHAGNMFFKTAW